jgi:acyl-CoA reductase-like NAD-dependent aldehyde dehydrogenase
VQRKYLLLADVHLHRFVNTINGQPRDSEARIDVINPATGVAFCSVPQASKADLDDAVRAAALAQREWAALTPDVRRRYIGKIGETLREHQQELASLLVLEQGKPMARALDEITRAAAQLDLLLQIELRDDEVTDSNGRPVRLHYRPLGVVGAITPWNMPIVLMVPKIVHALYTGNTIVVKPSPYTPVSSLRLAELVAPLLPAGVLNMIAGGGDVGQWMVEHPQIHKISFTGSVPTGKRVMASAAVTLKRLTLELGGNDAAIVLDDIDPETYASRIFQGAFANSGQVCMAIKRLYVHDSIYEDMCRALAAIAKSRVVADGALEGTEMGPLQNRAQFELVASMIDEALDTGGRVLSGGVKAGSGGYFIEPVIVADIKEGSRLVDEEQFGPVLPVIRYTDIDEVVARANASDFGLGASVWSNDLDRARAVAARLEAGSVWINHHIGADVNVPFSGAKYSGLGQQYSLAGLRSFTQVQALYAPMPAG